MYRPLHLAGAAIFAVTGACTLYAGGYSLEEFSQTYVLSGHGRIVLENLNGDVRITTWDRDEVRVEAIKRGLSQERLDDVHIVVDSTGSALSIRTQYAAGNPEEPASVEYRITVPKNASLDDIKLVNGGLSIVGVAGDIKASAVNGSIRAQDLGGEAQLSTINGQLEAGFNRICASKEISLTSVNGPILLSLPANAKASLNARNLSGGIRTDFGHPARILRAGGQQLRTVIKGGGTRIRLNNINGGISISGHGRRART